MMLLKWLTLNLRQVLRAYGEDPHALLAMSIFGRAGRGEAAPDQRDKLSIGIDVSVKQRCTHRPSCSMVRFDPGSTTTTARFGAFSLSFCADSQAIAVAFRLPVKPNPPFRSQSQIEASRRAAPPPVSVRR